MFTNNPINSFPDITDITFKAIHKNYLKVILWIIVFVFSIIFGCIVLGHFYSY